MSLFVVRGIYYYNFQLNGHRYSKSTHKTREKDALDVEAAARRLLLEGHQGVLQEEQREYERQTIAVAADAYFEDYKTKHKAATFAKYALGHVKRLLGDLMLLQVTPAVVTRYQHDRLKEEAAPKTINEEVGLLLRLCGDQADSIRSALKRTKSLKLKQPPSPGKPFEGDEQARMLAVARASTLAAREACLRRARGEQTPHGAKQGGSPCIYPALVIALNCGMRDAEIRLLTWDQIDIEKQFLTVGRSKTDAGTGRTIPFNDALLDALVEHSRWYVQQFGETRPEWFVFPGGGRFPDNPAVAITTLKTAWAMVRRKAGVKGRWHDNRHTLITELAESGAGDETIMEIAGHVSRQMLSRYSHIRMEAKRKALGDVNRQRAADKAQREKGRATTQAECNGAPVANVAQTASVQ
jgi:integrase